MTEKLIALVRDGARVVTDSRLVEKGDIFVALKGENHNGNQFAAAALERGAATAIIDDASCRQQGTILVDDALATLQELATEYRVGLNIPLLAITGTNGKTTTKELVARVLARKFKVHYTRGNLNNHIGVPLTILSTPPATTFLVVEMGANHIGEISALCRIAQPGYGLITNIGRAHLEGFGSAEGVKTAKSELYRYLAGTGGTVIYNDSNPVLNGLVQEIGVKGVAYSKPYGKLLRGKVLSEFPLELDYSVEMGNLEIRSELFGAHNAENITAAIATGIFFGVDLKDIADAINSYKPGNNRSEIRRTPGNTVICDAYNANPDSMARAIGSFLAHPSGSKTVIIADMLELGDASLDEHRKILSMLKGVPGITVCLVGEQFRLAAGDDNPGFLHFETTTELAGYLEMKPIRNSFVLLKGSRGMRLEELFDYL